jgi:threonine synthase
MYFEQTFPRAFEIHPDKALINTPLLVQPPDLKKVPAPGSPLQGADLEKFVQRVADEIADRLKLKKQKK